MIIKVGNINLFVENLLFLMRNNYFTLIQSLQIYNLIYHQLHSVTDRNQLYSVTNNMNQYNDVFNSNQLNNTTYQNQLNDTTGQNQLNSVTDNMKQYNSIKRDHHNYPKNIPKRKQISKKHKIKPTKKIIFKQEFGDLLFNNNINFKFPNCIISNTKQLQQILNKH